MDLEKRVSLLEKEVADLKRQLEERPKRAHTNYKVVCAAEQIIKTLQQNDFSKDMMEAVLIEAEHQIKILNS
jgi:hypothetical protein